MDLGAEAAALAIAWLIAQATATANDWTPAELFAAVLAGLSLFGGACWWMSALYSKVCGIEGTVNGMDERAERRHKENDDAHAELWRAFRSRGYRHEDSEGPP